MYSTFKIAACRLYIFINNNLGWTDEIPMRFLSAHLAENGTIIANIMSSIPRNRQID